MTKKAIQTFYNSLRLAYNHHNSYSKTKAFCFKLCHYSCCNVDRQKRVRCNVKVIYWVN